VTRHDRTLGRPNSRPFAGIAHPMDPGLAGRIEALKASIPKSTLSPAAVLAMVAE